jgi:O-6-methylguanine DNA methyltransferase
MLEETLAVRKYEGTWFGVVWDDAGLLASSFASSKEALEKHLQSDTLTIGGIGSSKQPETALTEMIKLYEGEPSTNKIPLRWDSVSGFQENVCQVMTRIPKGKVTSYGLIAKQISSGPRAVGIAVARNPWPLFVPCHRVVPATLEVGNYSIGGSLSDYGCQMKRRLLEREGVSFEGDRLVSTAVWDPTED